jgi:hypothetical protein
MRIVENTPERLVLRDRTLWISVICFAAAALLLVRFAPADRGALVGAILFAAFGLGFLRSTDLVLDKSQAFCSLRRLDVLRVKHMRFTFEDIRDFRVEVEPMAGESHAISCRLALVTADGVTPLTAAYEPDLDRYNQMRDVLLDTVFPGKARPQAADPVKTLVQQGNLIAAVALLRKRDGLDLVTAKTRVDDMKASEH